MLSVLTSTRRLSANLLGSITMKRDDSVHLFIGSKHCSPGTITASCCTSLSPKCCTTGKRTTTRRLQQQPAATSSRFSMQSTSRCATETSTPSCSARFTLWGFSRYTFPHNRRKKIRARPKRNQQQESRDLRSLLLCRIVGKMSRHQQLPTSRKRNYSFIDSISFARKAECLRVCVRVQAKGFVIPMFLSLLLPLCACVCVHCLLVWRRWRQRRVWNMAGTGKCV